MSRIIETNYGQPVWEARATLQDAVTHDGSDETILYFETPTSKGVSGFQVILEGEDRAKVSGLLSPSIMEWDDHYVRAERVGREEGYSDGLQDGLAQGRAEGSAALSKFIDRVKEIIALERPSQTPS